MNRQRLRILTGIIRSAALSAALFFCGAVFADQISVSSRSGGLELTGKFVGFDGTYLQIATEYGPVSLNLDQVTCDGASCPDVEGYIPKIRISGSPKIAEILMPALVEGFARSNGMYVDRTSAEAGELLVYQNGEAIASFRIAANSTTEGFTDLVSHDTDIVMATRPATSDENISAQDAGIGGLLDYGRGKVIGYDGVVPAVSARRDHSVIAIERLADVLIGNTTNWEDLDGSGGEISVHLGPVDDGVVQQIFQIFEIDPNNEPGDHLNFYENHRQSINAIERDSNGIGFVSALVSLPVRAVALTDQCGFIASAAPNNLRTRDFPLSLPLYLYTPERRSHQVVRDFFEWLDTASAQLVVRRSGFIDNGILPISLDDQGRRFVNAIAKSDEGAPISELQKFVGAISRLSRQSMSFRFSAERLDLDTPSKSDLIDLANAIENGRYAGRRVALIGFSNGEGSIEANSNRASILASETLSQLQTLLSSQQLNSTEVELISFGGTMPLACSESSIGSHLNQRVELWVGD